MKNINKLIEKEQLKQLKNPGKNNKKKRKEINKAKRGEPIPVNKVVPTKKSKSKRRESIKKDTIREINNN